MIRYLSARPAGRLLGVLIAASIVAACSGSEAAAPQETAVVSTTSAAATTLAPATTTTVPATTTTVVDGPVMPLTGVAVGNAMIAARPALVVKIDNHPDARPQFGLNAADIVYEENVEQLTRFAAVFHTNDVDQVGPIRSGRTQDVQLLGSLNRPLFAWSGGNARVTAAVNDSDLVNLSPAETGNAGGYFRERRADEDVEHTLYSRTAILWGLAPAGSEPPPQQFAYRDLDDAPAGEVSAGVEVAMDGIAVAWAWDEGLGQLVRSQNGRPHDDTTGRITAENVVVLEVDYQPSPADARSPDAVTVGTGQVWVFSAGRMVAGTWSRADRLDVFTLTAADGTEIELTPGRTWVELARRDRTTPLPG